MYFAMFGFLVLLGGNVDATPAGPTAIPGTEPPAVLMPAPGQGTTPASPPAAKPAAPASKTR